MTNAKKWLGRSRAITKELAALRAARKETFDQLTSIAQNYSPDGAQMTKNPHKFDRLAELNDLIDKKESELIETRLEITKAIIQVPSGNQRAVLLNYYVAVKTLEQIAVENGCSARNVQNVRTRGIFWIEKNIPEVP